MRYECPPDCPPHDPIRCPRSRPVEVCLAHLIVHPADEQCPTCAAYIAAGL